MLVVVLRVLRISAMTSLVANIIIVITGGAVRLTGSGLGCPTWPRCTDESYTSTAAMGINGAIEFGNRVLSILLGIIALATVVAAYRQSVKRADARALSLAILAGVGLQGLIGGITVRTGLNPWIVGVHFIISTGLITLCYALWRRTDADVSAATGAARPPATATDRGLGLLAWAVTAVSFAVITIGVLVTGSGPHSGDEAAGRNGFDPVLISQLHVDAVFLMLGLTLAGWLTLRAFGRHTAARAALILLAVLLGQGLIGFVQYFTHLPIILVGAHMAGACLVWVATLRLHWTLRRPTDVDGGAGRDVGPAGSASIDGNTAGDPALVTIR
jgi:heme a synthase